MKNKKWIQGAIKNPGALHKELGVPEGENIPKSKLEKAAKKPGVEGRRARFAEVLASFHRTSKNKDSEKKHKKESVKENKKKPEHSKQKESSKFKNKLRKVMEEFKHGVLHSGSKKGPKVVNEKQAIAIGISEAKKATKKKRK